MSTPKKRMTAVILIFAMLLTGIISTVNVLAADSTSDTAVLSAGTAAKKTKKYTKYNGVDLSEIYDYDYYVTHNSSAKKHFKKKPKAAILYFGRYAIRKNVKAKEDYSKETYKKLYKKTHPFPEADKILDRCGWNVKKAFLYSAKWPVSHAKNLKEWGTPWNRTSKWYFDYLLKNKAGNCYCKSGMFTVLAKEMGYDVKQIGGTIPYQNRPKGGPHSWVEITIKGKLYVCDASCYAKKKFGYMIKYKQPGSYVYTNKHKMKIKK